MSDLYREEARALREVWNTNKTIDECTRDIKNQCDDILNERTDLADRGHIATWIGVQTKWLESLTHQQRTNIARVERATADIRYALKRVRAESEDERE